MLFCGGFFHLSPRWGLGVGQFDTFLYTYRPAGGLDLGSKQPVFPYLIYSQCTQFVRNLENVFV